MRRVAPLIAIILAILLLAGCSGESPEGQEGSTEGDRMPLASMQSSEDAPVGISLDLWGEPAVGDLGLVIGISPLGDNKHGIEGLDVSIVGTSARGEEEITGSIQDVGDGAYNVQDFTVDTPGEWLFTVTADIPESGVVKRNFSVTIVD